MKVYSHNNKQPQSIPFRITLPDGRTRTDPSSFKPEEIAAAGYVEAPDPPAHDSTTQAPPKWDRDKWTVRNLTQEEKDQITQEQQRVLARERLLEKLKSSDPLTEQDIRRALRLSLSIE